MKETTWKGKKDIVKCPNCGSKHVKPVHSFDYVKQCQECGYQFSTGVHN